MKYIMNCLNFSYIAFSEYLKEVAHNSSTLRVNTKHF